MIFIDTYKKIQKHDQHHVTIPDYVYIEFFFYILHACKNAVYSLTLIISTVLNSTYQKYHLKDL